MQTDLNLFDGFVIKRFDPGVGLMRFENGASHMEASSFLDYQCTVDDQKGLEVETVNVCPNQEVPLPCSVRGNSEVMSAGSWPSFVRLDQNNNLKVVIPEGCVVRVEFLGKLGSKKHVKYFSCL